MMTHLSIPLGEVLAFHAGQGRGPALTHEGLTLSYDQLDARSTRRAQALAARGVRPDDLVIIALPNGIEFFETTFALWKLGATPCPVSPTLPPAEREAIVETAGPRMVIGGAAPIADTPWLRAGHEPSQGELAQPLPTATVARCWKALTSGGSTGRPKVILTRTPGKINPLAAGYALQEPGDIVLNPGPLYHNAAFSSAHQCLFAGGHVINMARFDAEFSLGLIEQYRANYVMMVPTMMSRIWNLGEDVRARYDISSLRTLVHLAAPCPAWLKEKWIGWIGAEKIFEIYAGTEGVGATCITGAEWLKHRGSVGRVVGGAKMRVLDEGGAVCAPGEVGEIYFRPPPDRRATFAYVGAETKRLGEWISLGDLGSVDEDGFLYLADRRTDLIVSGGANIYPAEVEAAIDSYPQIAASVVIGLPDDDLGSRCHAIVQINDEGLDETALRSFLAERLVRYKIPRTFEFTTAQLRDDAGKARRSAFRDERIAAATAASK